MQRIESIARALYRPGTAEEEHHFTLLVLFFRLDKWLGKMGSISRAALSIGGGVTEGELRRVAESIGNLDEPQTRSERAVASARIIDQAGVAGLASRLALARREGLSPREVAAEELSSDVALPAWLTEDARRWIEARAIARRQVCSLLLAELALEDRPGANDPDSRL